MCQRWVKGRSARRLRHLAGRDRPKRAGTRETTRCSARSAGTAAPLRTGLVQAGACRLDVRALSHAVVARLETRGLSTQISLSGVPRRGSGLRRGRVEFGLTARPATAILFILLLLRFRLPAFRIGEEL